jgi:hypothetical protein
MPAAGTCASCNWWQQFDPILGRGECRGDVKKMSEERVEEMVTTGEAPNVTAAALRAGAWFWPVSLSVEWCGRYVAVPPGP